MPTRRASDYGLWARLRTHVRGGDVLALVATGLAVWAVLDAEGSIDKVQEGRRTSLSVTCGAVSALSEAGRQTITAAQSFPPKFEAFLEAHGFPTSSERKAQAQIAANAYVQAISNGVQAQVGPVGQTVVNRDGTLNCRRLRQLARAPQPAGTK
jgi:hypothetical protein